MSSLRFKDGDVDIILSPHEEHQYRLHAQVLREGSSLFADMLAKAYEAPLGNLARRQGKVLFHVELSEAPSGKNKAGLLARMELNEKGFLMQNNPNSLAYANDNGKVPQVPAYMYKHYHNCFASLYNKPLELDEQQGLPKIMAEALGLMDVAEYLGCTPVVSKSVEVILMKYGQNFFRAISKNPTVWLNQSLRMKSEGIFREAVIHCVGQWNSLEDFAKEKLDKQAMTLVKAKIDVMLKKGKSVESRIISLYPRSIQRAEGENSARAGYAGDVMFWIALCFYRHWFGQQIINDRGPRAKDGGYEFFTQLGQGGSAYLDRTVLNIFHNRFQMSKKGSQVVENHVLEIKELVKMKVVESGILENNSQLDLSKHPVNYLVSCPFEQSDIPWELQSSKRIPEVEPRKRKALEPSESEDLDGFGEDEEEIMEK